MDIVDSGVINDVVTQAKGQFDVWLHTQVFNNSFLIAGVGTVLLGALSFLLRSVPSQIKSFFLRTATVELTINNDTEAFHAITKFVQGHRIKWLQRTFLLGGGIHGEQWSLGPGYGTSVIWYKRCLILGQLFKEESQSRQFKLSLRLRFITRNKKKLAAFLEAAEQASYTLNRKGISIYSLSSDGYWNLVLHKKNRRELSSVFITKEVKSEILGKLCWFYDNEDWYTTRGLTYKYGILLTGPGGTGKSSLIHALASHFDKNIRMLNLNVLTDNNFSEMLSGLTNHDMLVIEDIDTFAVAQKRVDDEGSTKSADTKLSLTSVLNMLDGLVSPHGVVVIATSNYPELLDGPLMRKGRFDLNLEIGLLDAQCLTDMFVRFYGEDQRQGVTDFVRKGLYCPTAGAILHDIFRHCGPVEALEKLKG